MDPPKSDDINSAIELESEDITRESILILNSDCLLHILKFLNPVDLVNFAETCIRIRNVTEPLYSKYSIIEYSEKLFYGTKDETVKRFFLRVGRYITSLSVNSYNQKLDVCEIVCEYCHNIQHFKYKTRGFDQDDRMFRCKQSDGFFGRLKSLEIYQCHIAVSSIFCKNLEILSLIKCSIGPNVHLDESNVLHKLVIIKCEGPGLTELTNSSKDIKELVFYAQGDLPTYNTIKNIESLDVDVGHDDLHKLKKIFVLRRLRTLRLIINTEISLDRFLLKLSKKNCLLEELHAFQLTITTNTIDTLGALKKLKVLN